MYNFDIFIFSNKLSRYSNLARINRFIFRYNLVNISAVLFNIADEWSPQEMDTFTRALIDSNKDFVVVAKQVA